MTWWRVRPTALKVVLAMGAVVFVVVLVATVVKWAPHWLASTKGINDASKRADEYGRVRTALLATLAGSIAVVGAIYTARTFALSRQGQITERFTRAVDQLGNDSLDVRLGGIYALERLARDSQEDHGPIMEILTAYVPEHAPQPTEDTPILVREDPAARPTSQDAGPDEALAADRRPTTDRKPTTDVQAILTVLGRRTREYDTRDLDLARTALIGAYLPDADLRHAVLNGTDLQGADLSRANLEGARLERANLQGAGIGRANLQWAHLQGANLAGVNLSRANLQNAFCDDGTTWPDGFDYQAAGVRS